MRFILLIFYTIIILNANNIKQKDFNFKIPIKCKKLYKYYKYSKKVNNKRAIKRYKKLVIACSK